MLKEMMVGTWISLVIAAVGIGAHIGIYVLKGSILYFMLFLGIVFRHLGILCFLFLTFKIAINFIANILSADWAMNILPISESRQLFLVDVSVLGVLLFSQFLWYRHGGA